MVMERFQGVASQLMSQVFKLFLLVFLNYVTPSQRIIRLGGAVDDDGCNLIVAQLLWLDSIDHKKVN
jgi:ATP-dependent Clp protease protease subunit